MHRSRITFGVFIFFVQWIMFKPQKGAKQISCNTVIEQFLRCLIKLGSKYSMQEKLYIHIYIFSFLLV